MDIRNDTWGYMRCQDTSSAIYGKERAGSTEISQILGGKWGDNKVKLPIVWQQWIGARLIEFVKNPFNTNYTCTVYFPIFRMSIYDTCIQMSNNMKKHHGNIIEISWEISRKSQVSAEPNASTKPLVGTSLFMAQHPATVQLWLLHSDPTWPIPSVGQWEEMKLCMII